MFRIMLVDDHPTMRMGLRLLLGQQPQLSLVGEANSAEEALPQIDALRPDVVVVDCQLPQQSGIALVSTLRARNHPTRLLALSAYDDEHYVRGMIAAGASGYLTKEDAPHNIVSAVLAVAEGNQWFSPAILATLEEEALDPHEPLPHSLTPREREVLPLVVAGESNRAIAIQLHISEKTVEKHLRSLFLKLGASSRVEVATRAMPADLCSPLPD